MQRYNGSVFNTHQSPLLLLNLALRVLLLQTHASRDRVLARCLQACLFWASLYPFNSTLRGDKSLSTTVCPESLGQPLTPGPGSWPNRALNWQPFHLAYKLRVPVT